jgi:hypothetical protein
MPRIQPVPGSEWTSEQGEILETVPPGGSRTVFDTLARYVLALDRISALGRTIRGAYLPVRRRLILILQTVWNCSTTYAFIRNRKIARKDGSQLDDEQLALDA